MKIQDMGKVGARELAMRLLPTVRIPAAIFIWITVPEEGENKRATISRLRC